jgi:hypothetical protein
MPAEGTRGGLHADVTKGAHTTPSSDASKNAHIASSSNAPEGTHTTPSSNTILDGHTEHRACWLSSPQGCSS